MAAGPAESHLRGGAHVSLARADFAVEGDVSRGTLNVCTDFQTQTVARPLVFSS